MQLFKGDSDETKVDAVFQAATTPIETQLDLLQAGAEACQVLGDYLWLNKFAPLTTAIDQTIFRAAFVDIFNAFITGGTFETYLTVFKTIFGPDVSVTFTVPAPGKLTIAIVATNITLFDFVSRQISGTTYTFDNVVTEDLDQIVFQAFKGFATQYELNQMLFEMVPGGIFTTISLTF